MTDQIACINCYFWQQLKSRPAYGQCRRFPPAVGEASDDTFFPTTVKLDWCGEYKTKNVNWLKEPEPSSPSSTT